MNDTKNLCKSKPGKGSQSVRATALHMEWYGDMEVIWRRNTWFLSLQQKADHSLRREENLSQTHPNVSTFNGFERGHQMAKHMEEEGRWKGQREDGNKISQ